MPVPSPLDMMKEAKAKQKPVPPLTKPQKDSASAEDTNVPQWVLDESKRMQVPGNKKGGTIKKYAGGGAIRGGGCESKGHSRGKMR